VDLRVALGDLLDGYDDLHDALNSGKSRK